ncbi:MAG: hypothetical protein KKA05_02330 [Alphaproteobacteria bacterium]|nr:hypothetical protein [Alphaproteobacteria bacterium]MBU0859583.1 hypothetical protein [Alphaproteobacteria bacterium]
MQSYNNTFIYVNDRPVGYVQDVDTNELEKSGFQRITADFNQQGVRPVKAATPMVTIRPTAPAPK